MPRIYNIYFLGSIGQIEVGTFTDIEQAKYFKTDCLDKGIYVKSSQHDLGDVKSKGGDSK